MALKPKPEAWLLSREERWEQREKQTGRARAHRAGGLTQSTRVFMRRSILVLLNFVLPLFCISLVSGPGKEAEGLGKPNNACASGLRLGFPDSGHQGGKRPGLEERLGFRAGESLPHTLHQPMRPPPTSLRTPRLRPSLALLSLDPRRLTGKDDQAEAPLGVPQHAAPQEHVLVAQRKLVLLPVEGATEFVQLVVGRLADHFALGKGRQECLGSRCSVSFTPRWQDTKSP